MIDLRSHIDIQDFPILRGLEIFDVCQDPAPVIDHALDRLASDYDVGPGVAVHRSATIEDGAVLKAPCIVGPDCVVAAGAYLHGGVWLARGVSVGPGTELLAVFVGGYTSIGRGVSIAHSLLGSDVIVEPGAVFTAQHIDRGDKRIRVLSGGEPLETGVTRFGAIVGSGSRIGANAVLSPGTILGRVSLVPRLALIDQSRR